MPIPSSCGDVVAQLFESREFGAVSGIERRHVGRVTSLSALRSTVFDLEHRATVLLPRLVGSDSYQFEDVVDLVL